MLRERRVDEIKKNKLFYLLLICIILFLIFYIAYLNDLKPTQYIVGSYQSSEFLNYLYDLSVKEDGSYTIYFNNNISDSGNYEQISDYTYLFEGEKVFLVNLYKEKFYYYDEENSRIIEFIKKSSIPMDIKWPKKLKMEELHNEIKTKNYNMFINNIKFNS